MSKFLKISLFTGLLLSLAVGSVLGRAAFDRISNSGPGGQEDDPAFCYANHRIGQIVLAVGNDGTFGIFGASVPTDCFTDEAIKACEYPKNSKTRYLYAGAFWIGAVVGRDTLVSEGADGWDRQGHEFAPDIPPFGNMKYRSIRFPEEPELYENAVSEEDYIAIYTDNNAVHLAEADNTGRPHIPLNIEVTQKSYAWSYPYAEDFVLFDYEIKNIGYEKIEAAYMGLYVDGDVGYPGGDNALYYADDICGFIETLPTQFGHCDFIDTVNIAWIADDDGDPKGTTFDNESTPNVTATRIIRTPADVLDVSFNWWVSNGNDALDYGPRERSEVGRWKEEFRKFFTGTLGTPGCDADKYYNLRNQEFDFDQIYAASIAANDTFWVAPPADLAIDIADGYDTRYLLSFGPFDIDEGEILPVSFAYIGGENLHQGGIDNSVNLPNNPTAYYNNLDFSDLGENAAWAARVYDNPGIDSDGDSTFGEFRVCCNDSVFTENVLVIDTIYGPENDTTFDSSYVDTWVYDLCDTTYYKGDGVPDFQGASPPPAPVIWASSELNKIHIRFNGFRSETSRDVFSRINDFEGYRVYISRDDRDDSFTSYTSYDIENYNKYVWNPNKQPTAGYELNDIPFTLEEVRCLYADSCNDPLFNPLDYNRNSPYYHPLYPNDSIFYFEKQDFNRSEFGVNTYISKIYPDQAYPSTLDPDSAQADELTDDGYFKYFEYQVSIEDLLPTVPWYVNVTAFDFGSPESGLPALETSKSNGAIAVYPSYSEDEQASNGIGVYVYPNPYRIDGGYNEIGYERAQSELASAADRIRRIHFENLPSKCTIKIFTLDGDLVREIVHDVDETDPNYGHDTWDLITRNTQLAVSGLYYWTVEADGQETQIGKLVLIM